MELDVKRAAELLWAVEDQAEIMERQAQLNRQALTLLHESLAQLCADAGLEMPQRIGTRSGGGGK